MSFRGLLYTIARILGDAHAVAKGRIGKRIARRVAGRLTGRTFWRIFR
jgi:hypothetical protein